MSEKQALVPRLRFPEFRDADEWEPKKLGDKDVSSFVKKRVSVDELSLDSYISTENILPDFGGKKCASKLPSSGSFTKYKPDDILIANIRPYLKKVWVADRNGAASNDVIVVRPIKEIRKPFLASHLKNDSFIDYVMKGAKGVKMPRGDISLMKEYPVAVPGPEEQQKVADCLSSLDTLIAAQAEKIDALKTYKKGLMQKLFPREGETAPRLRFSEFRDAGEWVLKPLSELVQSLDAGVSVNSRDRPATYGERGILKTSAVTDGVFNLSENKLVSDVGDLKRLKEPVLKNTIIISRMNTPALVGANAYIDASHENLFLPDRLWAAKPKPGASMRFVAYILGSGKGRQALSALATGTSGSMKNIAKANILELPILTPSSEEQQKIADCLSSLDSLIAAHREKLDTLKTHKNALMQQLFPSPESVCA